MSFFSNPALDNFGEYCIQVLVDMSKDIGITYLSLNVWLFCIIEPLFIIGTLAFLLTSLKDMKRPKRIAIWVFIGLIVLCGLILGYYMWLTYKNGTHL